MRVHLLTAPGILVIWAVTHPSTNRAQCCLTLVIKRVPVCPTWLDAVFDYISLCACKPCTILERQVNVPHWTSIDNIFLCVCFVFPIQYEGRKPCCTMSLSGHYKVFVIYIRIDSFCLVETRPNQQGTFIYGLPLCETPYELEGGGLLCLRVWENIVFAGCHTIRPSRSIFGSVSSYILFFFPLCVLDLAIQLFVKVNG
jgi:hypothetical protein